MRKIYLPVLIFLLSLLSFSAYAGDDEVSTSDLLFFKNHLSIVSGINVMVLNPNASGGKSMHLTGLPGAYAGFRFTGNVHKNFGIVTGFNFGVQSISYKFTTANISSNKTWGDPCISIPLLLNPRVCIKGKHVLGFEAGASMQCFVPFSYTTSTYNEPTKETFVFKYNMANNPYIQPEVGLSYGVVLKNLNIIAVDVRCSIGNKPLATGQYVWRDNDGVKELGNIYARDNYLSVGVNYTFTRAAFLKRKIQDNKLEPLDE